MREIKTANFEIKLGGRNVEVTNVFGDTYKAEINMGEKIIARSLIGMGYIKKALDEMNAANLK